ncbi:hypothetical protein GCM10009798_37940 [Nocardioides panacihumi]|uniref:Uncharacterized protein n=1 Tax=Nocardioides panacihumi TaxID=400774 RepID=A0ABN2RR72_9ACTN
MVHPVKTPLGAVRAVTHVSLHAVRHPVRTVGEVAGLGRGLVTSVVSRDRSGAVSKVVESDERVARPAPASESATVKKQGDPLARTATTNRTTTETATEHEQIVTEPSGVTGPGDADEIPSPAVQPDFEDIEVITPVGTTGAGRDYNPDTTESDLQQRGTEPLMDPATTKRIKAETDTLRRASDRQKK